MIKCLKPLFPVLLLPILALTLVQCGPSKPKLHLFSWSDIFDPDLIAAFEEQCQCRVVIDLFDSNESMYSKLKLSSAKFDVICPSHYFVGILAQQKMIQPLDPSRIDNLKNLDPKYFTLSDPFYAVPFIVGFSGIAYRKDRLGSIRPSYEVFARNDLRGRMTMLNDSRETLGAALKVLGYSINSRNPQEIEKAGDLVIEWKKNLAKFESEQFKSGISSGEFLIVQGYSLDIFQVQNEDKEVEFIFPQEGVLLSVDCLAIPAGAENLDLAYKFINFMLSTESAAKNIEFVGALTPVTTAYPLLTEEIRKNPMFFPSKDQFDKMERIEDLQGDVKLYYKTWDRVKAS